MFKLFRRIRLKALNYLKIRKYFLYVIGEISLIVVGILIALQVNIWNENRKQVKMEVKILNEIKKDLNETLKEIKTDLESHVKAQKNANSLKEILITENNYSEELVRLYFNAMKDRQVYPKSSGYEAVKSKGLEIISNDELRQQITNLYQLEFKRLLDFGATQEKNNITDLLRPYLKKHFYLTNELTSVEELEEKGDSVKYYKYGLISYEKFKNDTAFMIDFQHSFDLRRKKINRHKGAMAGIEEVIAIMNKEIGYK